jgi:hypothetical protein
MTVALSVTSTTASSANRDFGSEAQRSKQAYRHYIGNAVAASQFLPVRHVTIQLYLSILSPTLSLISFLGPIPPDLFLLHIIHSFSHSILLPSVILATLSHEE